MTATTHPIAGRKSEALAIATAAFLGIFIVFVVGFAQPDMLHNAAHDVRHATGFACH